METISHQPQWITTGIRVAVGLVAAAVSGYAALVMLFIGAIEYTGCFMGCSTPNRPMGALLLAGAAVAAAAAIASATYAFFDRRYRLSATFFGSAGIAGMLILVVVVA